MSSHDFDGEVLSEKLSKLNNSQQSIESLSHWCVTHRKNARQIVETWNKLFNSSQKEQCVSLLYLANDILQNSRRNGHEFVDEFWKVLPSALKRVCEKGDDSGKKVVSRLVDIWHERKVFGSRGQGLRDAMVGKKKEQPPPVVSNLSSQIIIKIIKKDAQAVRVKLMAGSMPEKVVMAFHAVEDEKNNEEHTLKRCQEVLNAPARGAEPSNKEIQLCMKDLEGVEETRSALVSQLKEALQEQEAKLNVIRNLLQNSRRRIALSGTIKGGSEQSPISSALMLNSLLIPDAMKTAESNFMASYSSNVLQQLPASQPMTLSVPVQPTEEEKKKAAAAAMAAKLSASTSSAQMLTSVLSSLVAEQAASMNGGGPSHPPGFGPSTNTSMYPPEKRAKVENYVTSNKHFTNPSGLMMPFGFNTTNSLQPPRPPPLPPNITIGLIRPPTIQHQQQSPQQQQHSPASSGYYQPHGTGFYSLNNTSTTTPMPRQ